jgi:hypothetical protein
MQAVRFSVAGEGVIAPAFRSSLRAQLTPSPPLLAAKPSRASRLVVRAEEAAAAPKAAPKKEVGPKRGSLVSLPHAPLRPGPR